MPANMQDVARRAGVSTATVSRVLNNPALVSALARQRVLRAMRELDYKVNVAARSLRTNQTRTVAVVIPSLSEPIIHQVVEAIEDVAITEGYSLLLCSTRGDPAREYAYIELLANQAAADGVVYISPRAAPKIVTRLVAASGPVVLCNYALHDPSFASLTIDYASASYQAAHYLLALGHRRIALLNLAQPHYHPARMRRAGFERAHADAGVGMDPALMVEVERPTYTGDDWRGAIASLFDRAAAPTAVVAFNDSVALEVYGACRERGLDIPAQVSIIGCDDGLTAQHVSPPLTTIRVPASALGSYAMHTLLAQLHDPAARRPEPRILDTELIVRGSCAPPGGGRGDAVA